MITAFLIGVGVMCGITALLALLMVLAEATIGNYGEVTVTINDDRNLTVQGGRNLLSTLKEEEIFIPSACGGRGSCGLCKLQVLEGAADVLPTELPWLSDEEKKNRTRLSCQIKVKKDLRIRIPEELFSIRQYSATVARMRDLTHDIKEVCFDLDEPAEISFSAGQYIQLEVPEYELTDEPVYRAYSISSDPALKRQLELEIRYVPNGICTTYVHKHLKPGDKVVFNGPYGDFFLSDSSRPILGIAGGSGMAPLKSIFLDMLNRDVRRKATYFFGAKTQRDLFLLDEMKELEEKMHDFTFVPAVSDPLPDDHWDGETGLITEVVDRYVADAKEMEAYLCGGPFMIDACIEVLRSKGMPEERIFYDKFA